MTRRHATLALVGFALVAVVGIVMRPFLPVDETRYLAVAWEMWQSGDYLVPSKNFEIYSHKPPALFWAINLIWSITGVSDFAGRLVGPLWAILAIVLTGRLARMLWPEVAGIGGRAMLALAGMLIFTLYGGLTMFDAGLAAATVAGMIAILRAVETGQRRYWFWLGAALAVGGLVKGPVILVHVFPALILLPLGRRAGWDVSWRAVGRGVALALASGLALVSLWVVPASILGGPDYRNAILWTQSAGRMANSFAHAKPVWFYLILLPALLFPWFTMPALWRAGWRQSWRDRGLWLCLSWALPAIAIFSLISGKQLHYIIPEMAAVALIVARLLPARASIRVPALIVAALSLAGVAISLGLVPLGNAADLIEPRSMVLAWAIFMLGLGLAAMRIGGVTGGAVLSFGLILATNTLVGLTKTYDVFDSYPIATIIAPYQDKGIASYGWYYQAEFNFAGRLTKPVETLADETALAAWQTTHPDGVILSRPDVPHPDWPPYRVLSYRNTDYAIWRVADAPKAEPSS